MKNCFKDWSQSRRGNYEKHFCEIILNLDQCFRKCRLKIYLAAVLFGEADHLGNYGRGHYEDLFVCFVALRPMSTAMVIAGRSVHLTTLFPGQA